MRSTVLLLFRDENWLCRIFPEPFAFVNESHITTSLRACGFSFSDFTNIKGELDVKEIFGETLLPLASDRADRPAERRNGLDSVSHSSGMISPC